MAVRRIIQLGDPLLWQRSAAVAEPGSAEIAALVRDLEETLAAFRAAHGYGRGIAAPQIGVLHRVIFVRTPDGSFDGPMINPRIIGASGELREWWDSCFSFPDLLVRVARANRIRAVYVGPQGTLRELEAEGELAELLQHEIDHLDGILAVDRALSARSFATREEWERMGRPL
ncbi:MAG TPA: peptide deformylase [candidate division Zixibacteria bacterium]|nr:peptide deformylase [candidate division Zixibacteria bacterium]MDD4918036.1 peptide deformylase [candidate division Zixibacteria bacterium]MDM7974097.1 peptide deformylase [candidate division Zixibacteria bacterium]HOD66860.1 peptide deformylase [candidate division Zixibacteria bacterium]HOZ08006.1 peptide deformylase [candidate division Zixibacteria bacterium]